MLAPAWEGIATQLAFLNPSSYGSVRPHFAGNLHAPVRASGIEKEGSCPTAGATSPVMVSRDRSFRHNSVHQNRNPRWVGPHGPALASMGQQALQPTLWDSTV